MGMEQLVEKYFRPGRLPHIWCPGCGNGVITNTANTLHGRALPIASGLKMANPALKVIVASGDGDCTAIGGNHLIHAARRNIDLTLVVYNNSIYGMTGGQYSPMTPKGSKATTAPYLTIEPSFNLLELAKAAGATFCARATTFHVPLMVDVIAKGIAHKGFYRMRIGLPHQLRTSEQSGYTGQNDGMAAGPRRNESSLGQDGRREKSRSHRSRQVPHRRTV